MADPVVHLHRARNLVISLLVFNGIISFILRTLLHLSVWVTFPLIFIISALIIWLVFYGLRKKVVELTIAQEKFEELSNLLQTSKQLVEERNLMLQQRMDELAALGKISKALTTTMELDTILGVILEGIQKNLKFDRTVICLVDDKQGIIEGKKSIGIGQDVSLLKIPLQEKEDPFVLTVTNARPYIISSIEQACPILKRAIETSKTNPDISLTVSTKIFVDLFAGLAKRIQAIASIPLIAKDKVVGILIADNLNSQKPVEEMDLRALTTFTNQAGLAIENARLYNTERKFNEELQRQVEIAKQELQSAQSQLILSERMAALGEMAAVVAHEVRNPMASIRGSAQRIDQKIQPEDPNKKYTQFIMREIDRLERIVKNMLAYTRQPEPHIRNEDINQLLDEILNFMSDEITKTNVKIIRELDLTLPQVKIDAAMLRQVVLNIIQNAFFFMIDRPVQELRIATGHNGGNVEIIIGDTGTGIPADIKPRIFEPFFTTKASGTGLGLAICQRIVEAHKGHITVDSEVDKGSTFVISLPLTE